MAFNFPDPAVQQRVTNIVTGVTYVWQDPPGKWVAESYSQPSDADITSYMSNLQGHVQRNERDIDTLETEVASNDVDIFAIEARGVSNQTDLDALEAEVDQNEEQLQAMSTALFNTQNRVHNLESLDIQNALSALAVARQDIIDLKSKVLSLEQQIVLNLE